LGRGRPGEEAILSEDVFARPGVFNKLRLR
jgi:hypothetical protein